MAILGCRMSAGKVLPSNTWSSSSSGTSAVLRASILELKDSADIFKHGWITWMNVAMLLCFLQGGAPIAYVATGRAISSNAIGWQTI